MKVKLPVKIFDIVIILLACALTGFSVFTAYIQPQNTSRILIESPTRQWVFPLDAEETLNIRGTLGTTVIQIHGKEAWFESSPCDNQTCVGTGHVGASGDWIACLPNNVFLIIEGADEQRNLPDRTAW
jgi:hypothetical protein